MFSLPKVVESTLLSSVLYKILRANLVPRNGGRFDMTFQDLVPITLIIKGYKFNFALFMIKHMNCCLHNKIKYFPCGSFITTILKHIGINFDHEETFKINEIINEEVFINSKLRVINYGILFLDVTNRDGQFFLIFWVFGQTEPV